MNRIENLLRREIGLDAAAIGTSVIARAVRLRMKSLGLKASVDYARLLDASRAERNELVEAVVVTETWFFRDRDAFRAFRQLAAEFLPRYPAGPLRVLSVPCASGEEPYSLAMTLLDADIPPERFLIDAVDISASALARASLAVYGKNSFRGTEFDFRDRHFHQTIVNWPSTPSAPHSESSPGEGKSATTLPVGGEGHRTIGYALNPRVRACVRFYRDNLVGTAFLIGNVPYDFIFCRNLLIYFDRAMQDRALARIHQLLAPHGMLFVGPAEWPLFAANGFTNANLPMAFACRKTAGARQHARSGEFMSQGQEEQTVKRNESRVPALTAAPLIVESSRGQAAAHSTFNSPSDLDVARQHADAGRLEDAAAICEEHLRKEGPAASAYYLLGLVRDATGDARAIEYYRKALYLEPNHYETLRQISLLLEKIGERASAHTFKRRAERAQPRS